MQLLMLLSSFSMQSVDMLAMLRPRNCNLLDSIVAVAKVGNPNAVGCT